MLREEKREFDGVALEHRTLQPVTWDSRLQSEEVNYNEDAATSALLNQTTTTLTDK